MSCVNEFLSTVDGGRVLDAGCGGGRSTRFLANAFRSFESIVGIDPDKDSLDEARRQTDDRRISFRQLPVLELNSGPERFETVSIAYALHHVANPGAVLERLVSVLVPGGLLIVNEALSDNLSPAQENGRDIHHFKATIDRLKGLEHRETYRADEIRSLIRSAGVRIVDECGESPVEDDTPEERVRWAHEFLEGYLPFIEGRSEQPELAAAKRDLESRITAIGLDSPPHLFIIARKP
jgi:ubiquinone/menaquinone biosynthesis C-methylase UbiE